MRIKENIRIFKFEGASVKDVAGARNIVKMLERVDYAHSPVVISAMDKTINTLEVVVNNYFKAPAQPPESLQTTKDFHYQIIRELFSDENHPAYWEVGGLFAELNPSLECDKSPKYSFVHDQVVGFGELLSTTIISQYLDDNGIRNNWIDACSLIKTDSNRHDASIDWKEAQTNISNNIDKSLFNITQGLLDSDASFFTITFGCEDSDYTAVIFTYCLNAKSVATWEDVPGILNADPRYFQHTQLLRKIPHREAMELVFYDASVVHPKALRLPQQKKIPLYVRSSVNPTEEGSVVYNVASLEPKVPCFIPKKD